MTTLDLSPLYRSSIGFDRMGSLFDSALRSEKTTGGYPPYDIEVRGENEYAVTLAVAGFDIRYEMARTRRRIFRPRHAGLEPFDAAPQDLLVVFEIGESIEAFGFLVHLPGLVDAVPQSVEARWHPVETVIAEQRQPLIESAFVQQACLPEKELLHRHQALDVQTVSLAER